MAKVNLESAHIFSMRTDVRGAIRDALKQAGFSSGSIHNITSVKEGLAAMNEHKLSLLILDWQVGPEKVQTLLEHNRKKHKLESHPTYLIAAQKDDKILEFAKEYYVARCSVGDINVEQIKKALKNLMAEYRDLSPVRQVLLNLEHMKENGNDEGFHETLEKLLIHYPDNPRVLIEVAESYIEKGNWSEAEVILKPHALGGQENARIQHLYSRCCLNRGDYKAAANVLKEANIISPYNTERLIELGDVYLENDEIEKALAAYSDVLSFAPDSIEAKKGKSKGLLLEGDVAQAISLLKDCRSKRELSAVFNTSAIMAIKKEKRDHAFKLYFKALGLLGDSNRLQAKVFFNLGLAYLKENDREKAIKCFEKALALDSKLTKASHNLSVLKNAASAKPSGKTKLSANIEEKIQEITDDDTSLEDFEDELMSGGDDNSQDKPNDADISFDGEEDFDMEGIFEDLDDFDL